MAIPPKPKLPNSLNGTTLPSSPEHSNHFLKQPAFFSLTTTLPSTQFSDPTDPPPKERKEAIFYLQKNICERRVERCKRRFQNLLETDLEVRNLLISIHNSGCQIPHNFFHCQICPSDTSTAFTLLETGVVICAQPKRDISKSTIKGRIIHELIHVYDFCSTNLLGSLNYNLSGIENNIPLDLRACTEIRAANLSGECKKGLKYHHPPINTKEGCVWWKSVYSVEKFSPKETGVERRLEAIDSVNSVWNRCIYDRSPMQKFSPPLSLYNTSHHPYPHTIPPLTSSSSSSSSSTSSNIIKQF